MNTFPKVWDEMREKNVETLKPGKHDVIIIKDSEISSGSSAPSDEKDTQALGTLADAQQAMAGYGRQVRQLQRP